VELVVLYGALVGGQRSVGASPSKFQVGALPALPSRNDGCPSERSVIRLQAGRGLIEDSRGSLRQSGIVVVVERIDSKLDESRRQ
jgi:hypothetical protein